MKLLFIISCEALSLLLTNSVEASKLEDIESSIETLNSLDTRQESLKGCSTSSLDKCYGIIPPDGSVPNDLLEEIGHISDAQTCQRFCNELYNGTCQWFMYDRTTNDCMLFSSPLNDLWNDCREVGYAREPDHELCDEMFQSDSINGCYNFREDYCRFEFSLLENLEEIDSLSECQLACQYINNCSYFVYDSPSKICKLNTLLSQKTCDIIHGTPQPDLSTCISGGKLDWASNSVSTPTGGSNSTNGTSGESLLTTGRPETTTAITTSTTTTPAPTTTTLTATHSTGACSDGSDDQVFKANKMVGCDGGYTRSNFRTACAEGWHVATASEYFNNGGKTVRPTKLRFIDVTWDSTGKETSLDNFQGYHDCGGLKAGWQNICTWNKCDYVSTSEECYLDFVNFSYGKGYGCHCRGNNRQGVICAK